MVLVRGVRDRGGVADGGPRSQATSNFVLACVTDPGRVPRVWPWDPSKTDPSLLDKYAVDDQEERLLHPEYRGLERKIDGRTRFCKACNTYKPDRTHHCRKLGRCVLEMDHWCAWVRNTIGYRNKKFFFLLISYATVTLLCYLISLGPYFINIFIMPVDLLNVLVGIAWILALVQLGALGSFTGFHLYLAHFAFTTIEFREKRGAGEDKITKSGISVKELYQSSPYDRGALNNWKHLLGPILCLWWLPTRFGMPDDQRAGAVYVVRANHPLALVAKEQSSGNWQVERA